MVLHFLTLHKLLIICTSNFGRLFYEDCGFYHKIFKYCYCCLTSVNGNLPKVKYCYAHIHLNLRGLTYICLDVIARFGVDYCLCSIILRACLCSIILRTCLCSIILRACRVLNYICRPCFLCCNLCERCSSFL